MNKTKIDWCDYTINPVKGLCPMACSYCYARRMYKRFKWNPELRLDPFCFLPFLKTISIKPSRIFIGSTMELFGDWIKPEWHSFIFDRIAMLPEHTFIFLTKQPQNLPKEFPDNCWVGVSTTGFDCRSGLEDVFHRGLKAKIKFVSIEPLLDYSPMDFRWVDWVIVGAQTPYSQTTQPRIEWVKDIIKDCNKLYKSVFLKNNLYDMYEAQGDIQFETDKDLFYIDNKWRQEFPK